jgi:hypothetical protein
MRFHLAQVRDITDMVTFTILIDVFVHHLLPRNGCDNFKCFQDRDGIIPAAADIIHFADPRFLQECIDEADDIQRMDVVADLLPFISENIVFLPSRLHLIR